MTELQKLAKLERAVRLAYQSPPPSYFNFAILTENSEVNPKKTK
jgi:hypothetical protein